MKDSMAVLYTYLLQEVDKEQTLYQNQREENVLSPYASQIELGVMISFEAFTACFLPKRE